MEAVREKWTDERLDDLNRKVDDLARRMDLRFDSMDRRFEGIDRRLDTTARWACPRRSSPAFVALGA